jgi:hypothetical protein
MVRVFTFLALKDIKLYIMPIREKKVSEMDLKIYIKLISKY